MDTTVPYDAASSEAPALNGHEGTPGHSDNPPTDRARGPVWRYSRQDMDRETTRYLSAAAQLDVEYAAKVVRKVISEPIRALAVSIQGWTVSCGFGSRLSGLVGGARGRRQELG